MVGKVNIILAATYLFADRQGSKISPGLAQRILSFEPQPDHSQVPHKSYEFPPLNPNSAQVLEEISRRKRAFPISIPFEQNTFEFLRGKGYAEAELARNFESAYPLIHADGVKIAQEYLQLKAQSSEFYRKLTLKQLFQRLITKRAVYYLDHNSYITVLRRNGKYFRFDNSNNKTPVQGLEAWQGIEEEGRKGPFRIGDVLTPDDMRMSALISFSSHTFFINNGTRGNAAVYRAEERPEIERAGVVIGSAGPNLIEPGLMEYRELIEDPSEQYDTPVDNIFHSHYKAADCPEKVRRFKVENEDFVINACAFYTRTKSLMQKLLAEANSRAEEKGLQAYLHVVGFGLGLWELDARQRPIFLRAAVKAITELEDKLPHVGYVRFGYIVTDERPAEDLPKRIGVSYSFEDPNLKLNEEGMLLVVTYAYDGNTYPGNWYWVGDEGGTSDSAAACSTQIAETQNPFINPRMSVENLRVATKDGVLMSLDNYLRHQLKDQVSK